MTIPRLLAMSIGLLAAMPVWAKSDPAPATSTAPVPTERLWDCVAAGGIGGQTLAPLDPALSRQTGEAVQALIGRGMRQELAKGIAAPQIQQGLRARLQAKETAWKASPAAAVSQHGSCAAQGLLPSTRLLTAQLVAVQLGVAAPAPAPAPAAVPRPAAPATNPRQAEFARLLEGPWGKAISNGETDSEMIMSTAFSRGGPQFTRKSCPAEGLRNPQAMLSHEFWFETLASGFGRTMAAGDPGKITFSWQPLGFKDSPDANTVRYSFQNPSLGAEVIYTVVRVRPDLIRIRGDVPAYPSLQVGEKYYVRCKKA